MGRKNTQSDVDYGRVGSVLHNDFALGMVIWCDLWMVIWCDLGMVIWYDLCSWWSFLFPDSGGIFLLATYHLQDIWATHSSFAPFQATMTSSTYLPANLLIVSRWWSETTYIPRGVPYETSNRELPLLSRQTKHAGSIRFQWRAKNAPNHLLYTGKKCCIW